MKTETSKYTGRGIVLIALGHYNYGNMAANLAASIRLMDKDIHIHLVHSGGSIVRLSEKHKALFTSMAECAKEYYMKGEKTVYIKAKTRLYELSPFEQTLFLDADMIWLSDRQGLKAPSKIFEALKDIDFTIQNRGFADLGAEKLNEKYCHWCNIREVKEVYKTTGRFYHLHSEFIYFNRSEANAFYFELVKEIFDNPKIKGFTFAGDLPDEFAFDIASAVLKHYPHRDNYLPVYWHIAEKWKSMNQVVQNHYAYSMGGSAAPDAVKNNYNNISKFTAVALKLPGFYSYVAKRQYLPERRNL